jgi:hypothetical protein
MIAGIYVVSFTSASASFGEGIVVLKDGFINGADLTYFYRGTFDDRGDQMKASVEVKHYKGPVNNILGPFTQFVLSLSGKRSGDNFVLTGSIENMPGAMIEIIGTKIADISG